MDHDRLFKELLGTFFLEFIRLFPQDVAVYRDPNFIEFLDKQTFTDVTRGEKHEADLVVKTRFRGEDACFLIHVENQASVQQEFGKRMFRSLSRLYERFDMPICPVALFSYDRPRREEPNTFEVLLAGFRVMEFQFRAIVLNQLNWRDFLGHPNPVAAALMANMNNAPEDRPRVKLECLRIIAPLKLDPARVRLLSGFVDSYLRLNAAEQEVFTLNLAEAGLAETDWCWVGRRAAKRVARPRWTSHSNPWRGRWARFRRAQRRPFARCRWGTCAAWEPRWWSSTTPPTWTPGSHSHRVPARHSSALETVRALLPHPSR
jgi:hypothetical protein